MTVAHQAEQNTIRRHSEHRWPYVKLAEVCTVHPGQHILESDYNRRGVGGGYLTGPADFGTLTPTITRWTEKPKAWCESGDVLVTVKGAGVGKVNLAPEDRTCIGRQLMAVRPKAGHIDQAFLYQVLTTCLGRLQEAALGSTVPGLGREHIESLEVPLPPLREQQRIAAILREQMAAVEQARTAAQAQLTAARDLGAAYLRAVFSGPEGRSWPRVRIADVASVSGGIQKSPGRAPRAFHRPFLTVRNVQRGRLDLGQIERFEVTAAELSRYQLQRGDFLIVEGNGSRDHIGRNAIFRCEIEECVHQNHVIRVRPDPVRLDSDFASYYLNSNSGQHQMVEHAITTTGLYTLSVSKIEQMDVPVPSLTVQRDVAAALAQDTAIADKCVRAAQHQLDAIKALPAALLRRAFSGEQ